MITLTDDEKEIITIALNMRRNYIETGTVSMSAQDAQRQIERQKRAKDSGRTLLGEEKAEVKALSTEQMQLIIDMENLIKRIYGS